MYFSRLQIFLTKDSHGRNKCTLLNGNATFRYRVTQISIFNGRDELFVIPCKELIICCKKNIWGPSLPCKSSNDSLCPPGLLHHRFFYLHDSTNTIPRV